MEKAIATNIAERDRLMEENATLKENNAALHEEIKILRTAVITPESLVDDDTKVEYLSWDSVLSIKF